jgi:hypothetical protein
MKRLIVFFTIPVLFMSCAYGYEAVSDIAFIKSYRYQAHSGPVEIFYDDERPQKLFVQFAIIEIKGAQYDNMNHLLALMRERAQSIGADGVMNIRKDFAGRQRGLVLDAFMDEEPENYTAPVFTGIAIKYINEDSK